MNKLILTLVILTLFFGIAFGKKVDKSDAEKIAIEVYKRNNNGSLTDLKEVIPLGDENEDDTLLYIVPFLESGYVIVSGQ